MNLWQLLEQHAERHTGDVRLHLPAHRGGDGMPELVAVFGERYVRQDLTEVGELDDLAEPRGVLAASEREVAGVYGARHAFFLSQGSSQGVVASLYAATPPGGIVLLPQNCHRSALQGLLLTGARPVFYPVGGDRRFGVFTRPDLDHLEQLQRTTGAGVVLLVYPSYEGVAFPLRETVERLRQLGATTIVDAAHGSHFGHRGLPFHPAEAHADYTVLGLHKSGGALTPGALLLSEVEDPSRVREGLRLVGTSSPSYPVLASVALTVHVLRETGERRVEASREAAGLIRGPAVFAPTGAHDPTRRLIYVEDAPRFAEKLYRRFGILPEYVSTETILLLFGLGFPTERVRPWARAIQELPPARGDVPPPPLGEGVLTPRDAMLARRVRVPLERAVGEVAASLLAPSPPGIPLVWPGQRITEWTVATLTAAARGGQVILGLSSEGVEVVA
jgi:arginine decarboxylase